MSSVGYLGEIRPHRQDQALPEGWLWLEGQLLPIAEYTDLYMVFEENEGFTDFRLPFLAPTVAGYRWIINTRGKLPEQS